MTKKNKPRESKEYPTIESGEIWTIDMARKKAECHVACCDCSLVHRIVIKHDPPKTLHLQFYRDDRKTSALRRWHNNKLKVKP